MVNWLPLPRYGIRPGYRFNYFAGVYRDNQEAAAYYQRAVYELVVKLMKKEGVKKVVDVGCGHGVKLAEIVAAYTKEIVGIDMEHSINYCQKKYNFGEWKVDNIADSKLEFEEKFPMVICADVIEHMGNPDVLVEYLKRLMDRKSILVLSTPERDKVRGTGDVGPPDNPAHVREWNKSELNEYLTSKGLKILEHKLVRDREGKVKQQTGRAFGETCQVIVAKLS